jgi:hypothetical protein
MEVSLTIEAYNNATDGQKTQQLPDGEGRPVLKRILGVPRP